MADQDFDRELEETSRRVLAALSPSDGRPPCRTAWELKLALKVPHTLLHLSLGTLLARGKVSLRPDKLTYLVEPAAAAGPSAG